MIAKWPRYLRKFQNWLVKRLSNYYFCGYPVADFLEKDFFQRFRKFINRGFCYEVSSLIMLTFKDYKHVRMVRGLIHEERLGHSWIEVRYNGRWFVVDPLTFYDVFVIPRWAYYRLLVKRVTYTCKPKMFWSWPLSHQFEERLRRPETSHLWFELTVFSTDHNEDLAMAEETLAKVKLGKGNGKILIPFPGHEKVIISNRIIFEFMAKRDRLRPKAHTIRKALLYRKSYEKFEQKNTKKQQAKSPA